MDQQPININLKDNQVRSKLRNIKSFSRDVSRQQQPTSPIKPIKENKNKKDHKIIMRVFDKIVGFSIFMLFFGVPLFFTGFSMQGIIFEKQMYFYFWLLLGLVAWATKGVIAGEMKIKRTPLDFPLLGFWLVYVLATIFSVDRWHSFWGSFGDPSRGLMAVTAYIIAYYFILSNFNSKRLKLIFTAIVSSGIILIIWTSLAMFVGNFLPKGLNVPLSLTGSVTSLGVIFSALILIITTAILKIVDNETLGKIKRRSLTAILLTTLVLDSALILALYNYIPWLALFVGIVIFLVFILAKMVRPKATWIWLPMVIFVLAMVVRMIGSVSLSKVALPVELSLNYKISNDIALQTLKHKLLLGSGPATYGYDFSLFKPKSYNLNAFYNLRFFQGTGILEEGLATLGLTGIFFLLVLILSYIGSQFYFLYKDKEKNKLYSLGTFSIATIFIISALSLRVDGTVLLMTVLLSSLALASVFLESQQDNYLRLSLKASPKFALALAFIFMVVSAGVAFLFVYMGKVYVADIYAEKATRIVSQKPKQAINKLEQAIKLNPQESNYYIQLSQYYMALANQEASKKPKDRDIDKIRQLLADSITVAKQAKNMNPNNVGTIEFLALIYENAGLYVSDSLKLSEENYQAAQKLEPNNPVYYLKLGQIKVAMAQKEKDKTKKKSIMNEAKDLFQKSVDEKSNYANGYYQLALVKESLNELDQAIETGQKAVQINPKNVNYLLSLGRMYQERDKGDDVKTAEQYYKQVILLNNKNENGHFYLGLLYEKNNQKAEAKVQYNKVISLLEKRKNNQETIKKIKQMISNLDKGVKNTPESLGLIKNKSNQSNQLKPNSSADNSQIPSKANSQSSQSVTNSSVPTAQSTNTNPAKNSN